MVSIHPKLLHCYNPKQLNALYDMTIQPHGWSLGTLCFAEFKGEEPLSPSYVPTNSTLYGRLLVRTGTIVPQLCDEGDTVGRV